MHMEKSLQLRKQKALARSRLRRRLAMGLVRLEQVSLAATADPSMRESPLILNRFKRAFDKNS